MIIFLIMADANITSGITVGAGLVGKSETQY